jgi:protein CpxP
MADRNDTPPSNRDPIANRSERSGRRGTLVTAVVVVALLAGVGLGLSWRHFETRDSGGFADLLSPAHTDELDRMTKELAVELGATADQQAKLANIAKSGAADLWAMEQKAEAARGEAVALLSAPTLDRAAIERLAVQQVGLAEAAIKRVAKALTDAFEVLNPEQRRKLADRIFRGGPWARWYRG